MSENRPTFGEHEFRKATMSDPDKECVRVARRAGWVEIRDDKKTFGAPDDHRLVFTAEQFDGFLAGVRSDHAQGQCLEMVRRADGTYLFRSAAPLTTAATELEFTAAEVAAFLDGVAKHEFDELAYA